METRGKPTVEAPTVNNQLEMTPFGKRLPFVVGVGSPQRILGKEEAGILLEQIAESERQHAEAWRWLGLTGLMHL